MKKIKKGTICKCGKYHHNKDKERFGSCDCSRMVCFIEQEKELPSEDENVENYDRYSYLRDF